MTELNFEKIDLGSFGISEEPVEQPLRSTMSEAVKLNPDKQAHIKKLSTESGIPSFAVENDKQPVEDQLKFEQIDFDTLSKENPNTSEYLTNFENAGIAHDDIDVLSNIENIFSFGKTFEDIGGAIKQSFKSQVLGLTAAGIDMSKNETEDVLSKFGINIDIDDDTYLEQAKQEATEGILTRLRESEEVMKKLQPEDLNILEQGVRGGVESLANMAPGFGLMLLSGGRAAPLLATIGVQSFGGSYAEGRAEGLSPEKAGWFAAIDAAIEVGTELIPMKTLENFITGDVKGLGKKALKFALQEMSTEQLATLGQSLNQYLFGLDKQIENAETVEEIVSIQMQRQAVTAIATVVAGGAQIGIATGIRKTMESVQSDEQKKQREYVQDQQTIDRLNEQSEKSKLKTRDKKSFKQFVEKADGGNNTTVFIDAAQTALYLREKTRQEIEADPALTMLDEQVQEAAAIGGEVQIPVADFAAEITGTEHFEALRDSMTMSEETVSPFRQEQAQVETQNYIRRMMETAQENVSEYAEAQEIYQTVRQQLIDSGRVTPQNASVMANLVPAWATAKAQRENKTVQQVYEESGLVIEGPLTGERARLEGELDVLTQGMEYDQTGQIVTESENFKNWFGDSKVVDEDGSPLVVYHGTSAEFEEFKTETVSKNYGMLGSEHDVTRQGAFFTNNKDFAEDNFGPSGSFYLSANNILDMDLKESDQILNEFDNRLRETNDPLVREIDDASFELWGYFDDELGIKFKEFLTEKGYDGASFFEEMDDNESKTYVIFNPTQIKSVNNRGTFDPADPNIFRQEVDTTTENFQIWSEGGEVIESEDINDHQFQADTPTVLKVFHGTTHDFSVFDALRGNLEGQFGAINYFTSSEYDASQNYAGEGPDLTNRIELRKGQIEQELEDISEEEAVEFAETYNLEFDPETETYPEGLPEALAREELHGGEEIIMELFVKVDNPFVIGENAEWIEFVDNDEIQQLALEEVADNNNITVEEVENNFEEYEEEFYDIRWTIESEQEHPLIEAIQTVADRYDADASTIAGEIYDLGSEAKPEDIEQLIRGNEEISYAEDPETGTLVTSQMIAEVIEELGFDSIILKDAEQRFGRMDMNPGTAHVHIFDSNKTNIKSTENIGTFDPADPDIFKQPTSPGQPGARGYYDPENSLIRMTETSNLSTFLHEYGHFMYDMEGRSNTDMYQSINNWYKRDSAAVAKEANKYLKKDEYDAEKQDSAGTKGKVSESDVTAYIDAGTTGSKSKDAAVNRAIHEQFARGFEAYLMEGKAPSIELKNAFATIARWLTQIYTAIKGDLNVNLDAEMRQIYDRLLATDEQIAAAEARSRFEPMFTDTVMAGMTEKEFEAYKKKQEKVKDKQTETLREKLIKQLTRQTKKWWREEKADLITEETEKLKEEKVYITAEQLRTGDVKLDFATVKEIAGEEKTDKIGRTSVRVSPKLRGMTAKEHKGIHPDQAAAMFGYNSGAEMLHDIINTPPIKEVADTRAEAVMIERHGDILTDGTIERAADEAVKNEERGKLILQELKVLSKGTAIPTIDRMTIKAIAKDRIGQLSFREIFPGKYRKAELKASQEAAVALEAGDKQAAASAKMRQVMNYYLGIEASEAKAGTMKIVDRMSRYNKKKVREEIIKAGNDYWDQLNKILNRFEFRKSATLTSVENINIWMRDQVENEGAGLVLSNAVLDEGYITHWKNVPYTDLQGIDDSVKNIEHVARYSNKIDLLQEKVDFQKVVNDWVASMNEKVESRFKPTASVADDPAKWRKWGRWAMAQMTKIPFMASWLDGGERVGMSHQLLVQRFTDAYDAEVRMWDKTAKPVMDLILNRSKEDIKRHNTKYYIPEIAGTAFHTGNMMGHEIIAVALNTGNESNLRKLLLGEGWADPDDETTISFENPKLQAVLSKMTVSDWQLVQTIWNQMELLYPALAEVHRKTTGLTPPKIEKTPIEVQGMRLEGGYYPMKYDPSRDNRAQEMEDKLNAEVESMFSNTASIQASVNTGATNERTKYYAPVRLSLDVVQNHFQETIHYITHHDAVRQVNKLIRNNEVTNTIKEKLGPDEYAQLKPWLNDIAKDGREAPVKTYWDDVLQKLRFGITLGVMGFKASTGIIQIAGLSNTFAEMGSANTLQALRSVIGSPRDMRGAWDFASENSKVMNHRVNTMDREIKNAMSKLADKKGIKAAVQEASMKHIALIQTYMVDLPTWHAGYIAEMKRSGDEQKAFQYADWAIENIQGSGVTKDMASIMRGQSETGRMLTMFMTYFSSLWNLERDVVKGAKSGRYSVSTLAAKTAFLFVIPVIFEMAMRGDFGGDDEPEEKLQKMLTGVALYPVQSVPFVRDIASATIGEYGYNISPVASLIEQGTQSIPGLLEGALTDEEITKSQLKGASKVAAAAAGIPGINQAWSTGEHLYEVLEEGGEFTLHQLLFGPRRD